MVWKLLKRFKILSYIVREFHLPTRSNDFKTVSNRLRGTETRFKFKNVLTSSCRHVVGERC